MSALNDDHPRASIAEKTAGKLPEESTKRSFSKADARYWLIAGRLFKDHGVADYSCRFSHKGQRAQVCLNTSNQREAARRAADLFAKVSTAGWEVGLLDYRAPEKVAKKVAPTVGNLIAAASSVSTARRHTLDAYAKALRLIVSEVKDIHVDGKQELSRQAIDEWREKVNAVRLDTLTSADIVTWKSERLRASESDPLAKRRAIVTTNSLIRNAKALFSKKLLPYIEQSVPLPRPLPFEGIGMEKAPSMRYISRIDPFAILAQAKEDLGEADPEAFKVMILALVCGLRRSEIDNLLWRAFDFPNSSLQVESSEYHELKSEDSAGVIDIDADTLAIFRGFRAKNPKSLFVIESPHKPRNQMKARCYRCDAVFKRVLTWLRIQGVESNKPLHTMRKEIGSIIASEHGIFEASRYLRHSDIRITSAIYASKKKTVTPRTFEGLLSTKNVKEIDFAPTEQKQRNARG